MKKAPVSAIILTQNEEDMLEGCCDSLRWCKEILVIDAGSIDQTASVAKNAGCRVVSSTHQSFARQREQGLKYARQPWVFYIDADERVTPQLATEINTHICDQSHDVFSLKRENIFFGHQMKAGGWYPDLVTRIFKRSSLKSWSGDIHESPQYVGSELVLDTPLVHLSHRDIVSGLVKSAQWTPVEAHLLSQSLTQQVSFLTVMRKGVGEFWRRAIVKQGWKDGQPGLIEALIQAINRMLVYMQVWESQAKPKIADQYLAKERELGLLWEKYWERHQ